MQMLEVVFLWDFMCVLFAVPFLNYAMSVLASFVWFSRPLIARMTTRVQLQRRCITAWISCCSNQALPVVLARCKKRVHVVAGEGTANHDADWEIQRHGWINEVCRYRLSQPIIALSEVLSCRQTVTNGCSSITQKTDSCCHNPPRAWFIWVTVLSHTACCFIIVRLLSLFRKEEYLIQNYTHQNMK